MRTTFLILVILFSSLASFGQSKKEKAVVERTYLLSNTVFGTKDRAVLEDLFAKQLSYGHSSGKVENREEALTAASANKSVYTDTSITNMNVIVEDDAAIVRYHFKAKEVKADNTSAPLNIAIVLTWVKQRGKWRLLGRQAIRLTN